jgi:hypothetical protein
MARASPNCWCHVRSTCLEYGLMDYNIFTRNCHKFVSDFINSIQYQGSTQWTMVHLVRTFRVQDTDTLFDEPWNSRNHAPFHCPGCISLHQGPFHGSRRLSSNMVSFRCANDARCLVWKVDIYRVLGRACFSIVSLVLCLFPFHGSTVHQ